MEQNRKRIRRTGQNEHAVEESKKIIAAASMKPVKKVPILYATLGVTFLAVVAFKTL